MGCTLDLKITCLDMSSFVNLIWGVLPVAIPQTKFQLNWQTTLVSWWTGQNPHIWRHFFLNYCQLHFFDMFKISCWLAKMASHHAGHDLSMKEHWQIKQTYSVTHDNDPILSMHCHKIPLYKKVPPLHPIHFQAECPLSSFILQDNRPC